MSRSQSLKNLASEGEKSDGLRRASAQPLHTSQTAAANESSFAALNVPLKLSMEDMRRRIVHLNKELEQERVHSKNLKREKALEIRQVRDEEQRKAATVLTDLRSKLQKEKMNELTSLREQLHKEKEKDIIQIIRQKDEALRTAQQAWAKEKDEIKSKLRTELRSESREDTKRELEKERGRLEQEISDLHHQKKELEDTLKLVQDADKRKIDDIRRIHHEHEAELEKFKRNSWQESRQQMAEIRQLLNIIEQLEKKLGLEAGHSMRLRLEKDSLHDMLKKSTTYDAWDRMMSSTMKDEQGRITPPATLDTKPGSQELRMLQRKNVELSSLVRKLDEKNQQLATRNAELMAELEKLEKENRDKSRKLERKNEDLTQTNKRLESRNKMLLDEINTVKKARKDNSVKPRGRAAKEHDELDNVRAQLREQTRTIADLKQSLIDKDRRIELLRGRKKKSKRQSPTSMSLSADFQSLEDDDVHSVHSDFSEASEMSSSEDVDSKRIKKLAKELLALERAYALLQAHVGSAVDAERDEMEKQQLQSDLLESQTRIHELERMMDNSGQGTSSEEISQLQADNKDLYHKLVIAEKDRDEAQAELARFSEDVRKLKDQRDLLEFELEEMSQLSTAGSEDWDSRRPRSVCSFEAATALTKDNDTSDLSLEEIKSCLEELETEKENELSPLQQRALKQARDMLEFMAEKIHHMEVTESALRDKVRDLDLGYNSESLKSEFEQSKSLAVLTFEQETLTDLQWAELDDMESFYRQKQFEALEQLKRADLDVSTEDTSCMTDLVWEDLVNMESIYKRYLNASPEGIRASDSHGDVEWEDKECMTDLAWQELTELEENYRNRLEELSQMDITGGKRQGKGEADTVDNETMTKLDLEELRELESNSQRYLEQKTCVESTADTETMTDVVWEELIEKANKEIYLSLSDELNMQLQEKGGETIEAGIMTDLALSELVEMENRYLEYIEYESKVNERSDEPVEALPEIILDTFPEDITDKKDDYVMTELQWGDIVNLEDRCDGYERDIEELEKKVAVFDVQKFEKSSLTDMSFTDLTWNDFINLQEKCLGYECIIKELEKKLAYFEVEKTEKGCGTEISLQDLADARFNVEMKDAESMTDAPEDLVDNEDLPTIVLETFPGEVQTKDECDMTEGVWDEVVDLKNTYQDYRQNLEEMREKLAQFEVEKDDKESITDIAMQDLADLENLYREHLREVDSDSNSVQSHAEKESRECMTELTGLEIIEMEDFYVENAARLMISSPVVEKWEQESMTDITLDEMQYLEEAEEHYRLRSSGAEERDEKCTETDLTLYHVHYMEEMSSQAEFLLAVEKLDTGTITELTIADLELLEDTQESHQTCHSERLVLLDKDEKGVATELTGEDLKYLEDVEAAHEECLLDREESWARTGGSGKKQDAEIMTEVTMTDLRYLDEADTTHEECLRDREEEKAKTGAEKINIEVMTDLTTSDLQYLEDVESAHEECLVDKQEEVKASSVEKQNVEIMTDLTADLQYLEDVESAHEECLEDKQDVLEARKTVLENDSVAVMTDLTVLDLQYLQDVETAHEECLAEKGSQASKIVIERQSVEIMTDLTAIDLYHLEEKVEELETRSTETENAEVMTDLTASDLQYLDEIEALHEECLGGKQEELEAKEAAVEKENAEIMTELTVLDLQYLEDRQEELDARDVETENAEIMTDMTASDLQFLEEIEAVHEECLVDRQELGLKEASAEKKNVEVITDLTVLDLQYWEDVEAAHEECLADKPEESEANEIAVEKGSVEVMTELTALDLQHLEDRQEELDARDVAKENAEIMTDMTASDLQYLEEIEVVHEECLVDKQEELELKECLVEKENVEVMTDLTVLDLQYLEDVEAVHKEYLADKQEESQANEIQVEKGSVEVMTELTGLDLQYLEEVESAHEKCLQDKTEVEKQSVGTMTDLTNHDLRSLESTASAKERRPSLWRRRSRSSSVSDHQHNKNIMTEMTGDILEYYEDIEALYKETIVELEDFKRLYSVEKEEKDAMTDLTIEDLKHLGGESEKKTFDEEGKETDDKEVMTELSNDDLEYLMAVEDFYKESKQDPKSMALESDIGRTQTVLSLPYIEHAEEGLGRVKPESSLEAESSWVVIEKDREEKEVMTEMTKSELEYLEEVEVLYRENIDKPTESVSQDNASVMTDLTTAELEYFEEAESLLRRISGDGGHLAAMLVPKDDKEVATDLKGSDIEHLEAMEDAYGGGNRHAQLEVEKEDKGTETELTIAGIRDLEDQVEGATEGKTSRQFQEFVREDFKPEMLVDLQSELNYLPILDEPEFILDEEDGEVTNRQETGVMTELTIADIRDLEDQVESATDVKRTPLVNEDYFQVETLESLQTQLDYLPVLDEPEYQSDDEETQELDILRQDAAVMTVVSASDLEHLLEVEKLGSDLVLDSHLNEIQKEDNACLTDLTLTDLEYLEAVEPHHSDEVLTYPERSETGIQCELEDLASLMQELSREAEEHGEVIPTWFVTAVNVRRTNGGFNPVHLVVGQSDDVKAFSTDEHSVSEVPSKSGIQKTPLSHVLVDSVHSTEDSPRSLHGIPNDQPDSWIVEDDDAAFREVGIQCDILDVLALLAEYQRNANEDSTPLYVSAMNMARDDTGYDAVQVLLRNRSDSNPVQDELLNNQTGSFKVELSCPPPPPTKAPFTVAFAPNGEMEGHQSEFPEADSSDPLYTSQDGRDSVFNRTGESVHSAFETEERDVLTEMPQAASAVNRFDRFLKERKDSELLNLQKLKENLDETDSGETVDVKTLKELEDENALLRRKVQMLEDTTNTEELENEIAMLKGQVETAKDLEDENQLLKEEISILRESAVVEDLEEENGMLKEKVKMLEDMEVVDQDVKAVERENEELKDKIKTLEEAANTEDLERENDLLKQQVELLSAEPERIKELEEENEMLQEKLQALRESTNVEDLVNENSLLKEQIESMVEPEKVKELEDENEELTEKLQLLEEPPRVKDLEEENEMLHEKIQALEESTNVEELVNENSLLKKQMEVMVEPEKVEELANENSLLKKQIEVMVEPEKLEELANENSLLKKQIEVMVEPERVKALEDENERLAEKVQVLEESSNVEALVNENALLKEQIEMIEEAGRSNDLEYENETLKEKVQMLEESATSERLGNEQLMEKMQDLEDSTARVVERLEEENAILKENIQILEDSTTNMKDLENENARLREKIESLGGSKKIQELEEDNASLKQKIRSLEESSQALDVPTEEFELLKLKVEQLKQAEKKIGELNEANMALKERIDLLEMEKKNVREKWPEMDPSEQLGKVRLLLVKEFGLTTSEVESVLGSCDLESLVSSGMATPRAELNNLGEYFEQADRAVQAEFEGPPSSQQQQGFSGGVHILKLLEVTRDGSVPEHIAKELEKLKEENRELYEELMELRRKIKTREISQWSNEATQTEYAYLASDVPRDASLVPDSIEETITPQVRTTVATEIRYLGDRPLEFESLYHAPLIQIGSLDLDGTDGLVDYPEVDKPMPSYTDSARDSEERISEPELVSEQRNLDSVMDDIDRRIQDLHDFDDEEVDRLRTDTNDPEVFDSDDDVDLPPLPESSPPPLPSEPPPDFPDGSPPVLDLGIEVLLRSESSPPRDAATLRGSSRARSHSQNKPPSEQSQPSSRMDSPLTVEEPTLVLESEPTELGGILPKPSLPGTSSLKRPTGVGPTKVPPQVLPKPKRPLLQMRLAGELRKPLVSYESTYRAPSLTSQWSRDEEDGVIPPRGIVFNRASSINRGEIDALNEKVEFLQRQLKNKENVIRSMKTEASELEAKSLLERKERELKILDEDVSFLKKENQKKERELLTKIGEMNKKNYEIEQWKAEAKNSERQRERMEAAYMNLQNQLKNLEGAELKLAELQTKYNGIEKQNFELSEKVKKLERTEREFKKLEHNIELLQAQVQEMDMVEQDRNNLVEKMKIIENQRDDLLRKGRVVESERNDFLRNNKLMEMQKDDLESRCAMLQKTNATLNSRLAELERETKEAQTKMHDSQHERNFLQVQLDKMEAEKNEMQKRLAITSQERNSLENEVAELQDLSRDHIKLEDGFHTLRIKLAETTREKDEAEMQIPTLKAKIALLRKACKTKDEEIDKLSDEIRDLRHAIAESAMDDLSKILTSGYSPENFVKLSAQREQERQIAKRDPEDLVEERLKSKLGKQSHSRFPKRLFVPSSPGTKKAKRYVVLFDYDPNKSPASEHPELELKLKEGDLLTVFGDMDLNGYFEAELNGVRGLVPSLYVDEVEDDNDSEREIEALLTSLEDPTKEAKRGNDLPLQREAITNGHITQSTGTSSVGSKPRQYVVALHDYDPLLSGTPGRQPHEQLSFKKGDVMTSHGDVDVKGFYRVDLNGQTGFVPGHLVEEVSSSLHLQPTGSKAPEQILGMLDNIAQARIQPKDVLSTPAVAANVHPPPIEGNVTSPRHVRPLPNVGLTRFKPSPEVANLGPSPRAGTAPVSSIQSPQRPIPSVVTEKPVTARLKPSPSRQTAPVSSNKSRFSKKARPSPPGLFRVLRPVNHDAVLLAWTLPEMDEFGRSNGLPVKGYKIYANGEIKLDVRSPYMAKALVEDLELHFPIKFCIKTVAENGSSSENVSTTFNDTMKEGLMDLRRDSFEDSEDEQQGYRTFVALYDYDPFKSSPNPNPASELGFKEGDILRVFDTSRKDGFYVGKLKHKSGLVPSNFVEEVAVASPRKLAAAKKRQAALPSPTRPFSRESSSSGGVGSSSHVVKESSPPRRKVMVALYDYNPEVQSPQDNPDSELPFKKGQMLTVIGEMSADGFYHADMNGQLGLVPGSFLDEYTNGEIDSGLESGRRVSFDTGRSPRHPVGLSQV